MHHGVVVAPYPALSFPFPKESGVLMDLPIRSHGRVIGSPCRAQRQRLITSALYSAASPSSVESDTMVLLVSSLYDAPLSQGNQAADHLIRGMSRCAGIASGIYVSRSR